MPHSPFTATHLSPTHHPLSSYPFHNYSPQRPPAPLPLLSDPGRNCYCSSITLPTPRHSLNPTFLSQPSPHSASDNLFCSPSHPTSHQGENQTRRDPPPSSDPAHHCIFPHPTTIPPLTNPRNLPRQLTLPTLHNLAVSSPDPTLLQPRSYPTSP